jgi:putative ABC transport system ATP-binding protein
MLQVQELAKRHGSEPVFSQVNLAVSPGEFVAIVGESGVGKSTLLNCLAGLDTPSHGHVRLHDTDLVSLPEAAQAHFRRRHLGFVFQAFHVLPHLTVEQNVALPLMLLGEPASERDRRVSAELEAVGLGGLGERLPQQLSGGQLQRVALARALVHRPSLILADEPTGNLDPETAGRVMQLLATQTRGHAAACIMVTHSRSAAQHADRVLRLTAKGLVDARAD